MKTPLQYALTVSQGPHLTTRDIEELFKEMEQDAFAAGERKGKAMGLRAVKELITNYPDGRELRKQIDAFLNALEREQQSPNLHVPSRPESSAPSQPPPTK